MSEKLKSVSEARRTLPSLSKSAQGRMDRYVITQQGQPQSVLLGYNDYQSMKVSLELLQRPDVIGSIQRGLRDLEAGRTISFEDLRTDSAPAAAAPPSGETLARVAAPGTPAAKGRKLLAAVKRARPVKAGRA